ncbi:hypothetical protein AC249_AIPGENE8546 [Exaiptasia diaphana]|nr:hypothetical protein AC249_AIPGENE8546 [Exaiptasia diaphana]
MADTLFSETPDAFDFLVYHVTLKDLQVAVPLFGGYGEVQVFLIGKDRTAISTLPSTKVTYYMKEMNVTIPTTINPGELGSIVLKYAGNLGLYVRQVTVKGPKNNYSAFYGKTLHSVHDSAGRNRYKTYRARLRKDAATRST